MTLFQRYRAHRIAAKLWGFRPLSVEAFVAISKKLVY